MIEKVAAKIIAKWLRKGNMARCMRDILPHSGLGFKEREEVARIVHDVVRFKIYYDYVLEKRGLEKEPMNYIALSKEKPEMEALRDIKYSMSTELASLTPDEFIPIINREPDTTLCVNLNKITREKAIEKLRNEGFEAREYVPETAIIVSSAGRYSSLIKEGYAIVQDASSQIISKIAASLGKRILDYCAGSGGKSLAMYVFNPQAEFYAYDINERKLKSLEKRAKKWGMSVRIFHKPYGEFDVVLVDAPCSGVGAAARNPEAKYEKDFEKYARMQLDILKESKNIVAKGGYLVYTVCSYTLSETENVIKKFLKDEDFEVEYVKCEYDEHLKREKYGAYVFAGDVFYISILKRSQ